jgi:hypothetical protein
MLSTLIIAAAVAQQATDFVQKFPKDEKTVYVVDITGSEEGNDIRLNLEYELAAKGEPKDGKTEVGIKVLKSTATFGGQEMPMNEVTDMVLTLDKNGVPTSVSMDGFQGVYYVVMMARYTPGKALKVGEAFTGETKMAGGTFKTEGSYTGDEELEGKKYAVLVSKGTFAPEGEDPGDINSKNFFDAGTGKVFRTEATISTPGGDFKMTVSVKK